MAAAGAKVPGAQRLEFSEPGPAKEPGGARYCAPEAAPGAHTLPPAQTPLGAARPLALQNCPGRHARHAAMVVEPSEGLKDPAGQGVGAAAAAPQKPPRAHTSPVGSAMGLGMAAPPEQKKPAQHAPLGAVSPAAAQ